MKLQSWCYINTHQPEWREFRKNHIPRELKNIAIGKMVIFTDSLNEMLETPEVSVNETCMIIGVQKNKISVIRDEKIVEIENSFLEKMLFCSLTTKLENKHFAITGLTSYPRYMYQNLIICNGGIYTDHVTKNTNYVINMSPLKTKKLKKAIKHGARLINEIQFFKMLT